MDPVAHIGNIPVEEWLPFVVPIVALYLYVRRKERLRRAAVGRLPDASERLDERTIAHVIADLCKAHHDKVSPEHLPLLYPPGPDGFNAAELADRANAEPGAVKGLLEELEDLEYLDLDADDGLENPRVSLTFKGYELVDATEVALLDALRRPQIS
jgi:hypothetical protein